MFRIPGCRSLVWVLAGVVGLGMCLAKAGDAQKAPWKKSAATSSPSAADPLGPAPPASPAQQAGQPAGEPVRIGPPQPFDGRDGKRTGWKVTIPGDHALATPAVVDGKVFIGGGFGSHEFYAFEARTGKMLWQYRTADDGPTAAVVSDGCVAFNTESCELEMLSLDGKPLWKKWLGDPLMSMPAISGGRLLMAFPDSKGDRQHQLACFEVKTGKELWRKPLVGEIITAPLVDDEQVLVATLEGTLYCFHLKDGQLAWLDKEKNVTSAPTLWDGRCWFSRRQEKSTTMAGKTVTQQMEQVAARALGSQSAIRDLIATARPADYLDYAKRSGMGGMGGMGMMAPASKKEAQNQKADASVGFDGGGIGLADPPQAQNVQAKQPPKKSAPSAQKTAAPQFSGKGDSKIGQAMMNLGQATVQGVWSYQGSRPFFYRGRLYAAMGDTLVCVDPKTEKIVWKREFQAPKDKKQKDANETALLDATITPPAISNGKLFLGTGYGDVVCLSAAQGELLWKINLGPSESIGFQPAVAGGQIFISTESGNLYGIQTGDPKDDGWLMWGANAAHTGTASPQDD